MKFLIKFPTRSRQQQFFSTLEKYINLLSGNNEYLFLISCDFDDISMNNQETIKKLSEIDNLKIYFSKRTTKIDAINRDINKINFNWDVLISAADDMIPIVKDYDLKIQEEMEKYFPDLDGCLWFYDGYRKDLNTQSIIGKKYYDSIGYIYYPKYKSWWCDNEHTEYCSSINKLKYIDYCIIKHELPSFNRSITYDKLYAENETPDKLSHDEKLFQERKKINFNPKQ